MSDIARFTPLPPAQVQVYVDAFGTETTIDFLLNLAGAEIYTPHDVESLGMIKRVIRIAKARKLAEALPDMKQRVPLATDWMAHCIDAEVVSVAAIARRLRPSGVTIRKLSKGRNTPRAT